MTFMKKYIKFTALVLAMVLALSLSGCSAIGAWLGSSGVSFLATIMISASMTTTAIWSSPSTATG